jgi:hypothetical protein
MANTCSLTPDRQALICSVSEAKADAWLMQHFDPTPRPSS